MSTSHRLRQLLCLLALALFGCLALASHSRAATITGIADENLEHWSAATWAAFNATGVRQVRHIVPWDAVYNPTHDPGKVWKEEDAVGWITIAEAHHLDILISFGHNSKEPFPSLVEYSKGVNAFRERFPQIDKYTAWNEPNHHVKVNPQGGTAFVTALNAADYWMALDTSCHTPGKTTCEVIAGDFLDGSDPTSFGNYIDAYKARLTEQARTPWTWAIHPYSTMASGNRAALNVFMTKTESKPVWFTEAGGMICNQGEGGGMVAATPLLAEEKQVKSVQEMQALLNYWGPIRVPRSYYYFLSAGGGGQVGCPNSKGEYEFDSALLRNGDTPRPAFSVAFPGALKPPTVQTGAPSSVSPTQATLTGVVDPRGFHTFYRFEYGPTAGYGSASASPEFGFEPGASGGSLTISGLQPGTTYHYRINASNAGGWAVGEDRTFTTPMDDRPSSSWAQRADDQNQEWVYYADKSGLLRVMWGTPTEPHQSKLEGHVSPGTVPSALRLPNGEQAVYYVAPSNEIREEVFNGIKWVDVGIGRTVRAGTNLSTVLAADGTQSVYYVNTEGKVKQAYYVPGSGEWKTGLVGGYAQAGASPTVITDRPSGRVWVYYVNTAGQMAIELWENNVWTSGALLPGATPRAGSTPTVLRLPNGEQSIFYVNTSGTISQYVWNNVNWIPVNLPNLGYGVRPGTNPSVLYDPVSGCQALYYVNSSGSVAQLQWVPTLKEWKNTPLGGLAAPGASPVALRDTISGRQWVFTREAESTLVWEWTTASWVWRQHQDGP